MGNWFSDDSDDSETEPRILQSCTHTSVGTSTKCIGHNNHNICDLPYNRVSFPGTHNSGAYNLDRDNFFVAGSLSCSFENHKYTLQEQLDRGIRYFDIDICIHENTLKTCHKGGYGDTIRELLQLITHHLIDNDKDIITVSFVNNAGTDDKDTNKGQRAHELEILLKDFRTEQWCNDCIYPTDRVDYSIKDMIKNGRRLVIYVANELIQENAELDKTWILNAQSNGDEGIVDTWEDEFRVHAASRCGGLVERAEDVCRSPPNSGRSMTVISLFGHSGLCLKEMAERCNDQMDEAVDACLDANSPPIRTANVLLIDHQDVGSDNIDTVIKDFNERNIQEFGNIAVHSHGGTPSCTANQYVRIRNEHSDQCIFSNTDGRFAASRCAYYEDQFWEKYNQNNVYFMLKNRQSGKCIRNRAGSDYETSPDGYHFMTDACSNNDDTMYWKEDNKQGDWFRLKNKKTGKCMFQNSDSFGIYRCDSYSDQQFKFETVSVSHIIHYVPDTDWKDNIGGYGEYVWIVVAILIAVNICCMVYAKCRNGEKDIKYQSVSLQSSDDDLIA